MRTFDSTKETSVCPQTAPGNRSDKNESPRHKRSVPKKRLSSPECSVALESPPDRHNRFQLHLLALGQFRRRHADLKVGNMNGPK